MKVLLSVCISVTNNAILHLLDKTSCALRLIQKKSSVLGWDSIHILFYSELLRSFGINFLIAYYT